MWRAIMFKFFRNIFRGSNQNITMDDLKLFIEKIKKVYKDKYEGDEVVLNCVKDATVLCGLASASDEYGAICIGKLKINLDMLFL